MSIKVKFLFIMWGTIAVVAAVLAYSQYQYQKQEYMDGIDAKLYTAARMAKSLLPSDYHDKLTDKSSISKQQYLQMIERYNHLCEELGLQYLWSNLLIAGDIVFTSSTSTSKNIAKGDHALFFDHHTNPESFAQVLSSNVTTYSTFTNKWGKGRMVLIPYQDIHGRTYVFGASISIAVLDQKLLSAALTALLIFIAAITIGSLVSFFVSKRITAALRELQDIANRIADGNYGERVAVGKKGSELDSLSASINTMSSAILKNNDQLNQLVDERTKELAKKENNFRSIITHSAEGIISTDRNGIIETFNPAAVALFGYSLNEIEGRSVSLLMPEKNVAVHEKSIREFNKHADKILNKPRVVTGKHKDGRLFPLKINLSAVSIEGEGEGEHYIALVEDISERVENEENLKKAKMAAVQANEAKSTFLSRMSHELRTPLNAIIGFSEIQKWCFDEHTAPQLIVGRNNILQAGKHLLALINDVLDLVSIEQNNIDMPLDDINLDEAIKESLNLVHHEAKENDITVNYEPVDFFVKANSLRLVQVLVNLLTNAIKYNCKDGSVTILAMKTDQGHIEVTVEDTGVGIDPIQQEAVFSAFSRLDYANRLEIEGTGIGLTLSKLFVEQMNGRIGFRSAPEQGTIFWFQLPQGQAVMHNSAPEIQHTSLLTSCAHTVLYIEDNLASRQLMEMMLDEYPNIRFLAASNAKEGIELAKKIPADIIFIDINLPDIDGISILKILKNNTPSNDTQMIALSADAMPKQIETAMNAGFDLYLTKPVNLDRITEIIKAL